MKKTAYKRVLIKLSGEVLAGSNGFGIDLNKLNDITDEIKEAFSQNVEIALVIGAGNIFRGIAASAKGMDRANADYMGMLGTVINAIAMQDALEKKGIPTRIQTAITMNKVAEPYIRRRAIRHLEKKRIVILAGGTGNPYFTTDTAATLRAMEIGADVVMKATRVDGIYDDDPLKNPKAKMFKTLTHIDVLKKQLKVMDATSVSLALEKNLPIAVFNLNKKGNIAAFLRGENVGTLIKS